MKFDRAVNLILEESEEKPKYELISPENYSRLYQENVSRFQYGYMRNVIDMGRISLPVRVDRDSDEVKRIKKSWSPAILLSGYELLSFIKRKNKRDVRKYGISRNKDNTDIVYIINDTTDISLDAVSWKYWLEPVITFKDYTSRGTADAFDKLIDEL